MPTSLRNDLDKQVMKRVKVFMERLSQSDNVNMSVGGMEKIWNNVCGIKDKKVSNFQNFCKKHRVKLREENPDYKFGDINRELGKMWKKLSDKEKSNYVEEVD